jgi:hypothetical protein
MHLRGKAMMVEAILPTGQKQVISLVSDFNFNWMTTYVYADDVAPLLPKGTILKVTAWHDNTSAKKSNPDPNQWVGWGDRTVDEMAHAWINIVYMKDDDFKIEQGEAPRDADDDRAAVSYFSYVVPPWAVRLKPDTTYVHQIIVRSVRLPTYAPVVYGRTSRAVPSCRTSRGAHGPALLVRRRTDARGLVLACARTAIPQPPLTTGAPTPATVALVETWPDGRVNYELSSPRRATMWTPFFPRVDGYKLPEGARPVYAVQLARVLAGRDIKVDVSVLLGSAQPPAVPVASVVISPGSHVVIEELRKFGVQPVTLSMVTVSPMTPYLPTVVSVSPDIEIANVELLSAPYPGYRITLRNLGSKAVSNVHVQSYRGEEKSVERAEAHRRRSSDDAAGRPATRST